ncbi:MAG TPA: hypothetical protein VM346_03695, partial [Sphingomicrobium sp.]|nr:hypothetical protein [Sphingomicrobium sp.]
MKRALLAATAITFASLVSTPALAVPPMHDTSGMSPQDVCDEQLRPNFQSGFMTEPTNVQGGTLVPVGNPYPTTAAGAPEGDGTPVYSNVLVGNGYYRNGQSPNVWAESQATATYPRTRQLFNFEQATQSVTTFDCEVWKEVAHGREILPPGLQSIGNSTTVAGTPIPAGQDYVITNVPFVVHGVVVNALICISPNNTT